MKNWDVYVWKETSGWADASRSVDAENCEDAVGAAMSKLGLNEAYRTSAYESEDGMHGEEATYFDNVVLHEDGDYHFEKKWRW